MPAKNINRLGSILPETKASVVNTETQSQVTLKSEMRAMNFIWNLPIISIDYLQEHEKTCGLCDSTYSNEFKVCGRGESPCCLPCGHIAGHQCLREHLSPYESGSTKCPFCDVEFPEMFTDPQEPSQPTGDLAWEDADEPKVSDDELSRQISQLSNDSGASSDEVKRFLSIDEVLARSSRNETEESAQGTETSDFTTEAIDTPEIGEGEFPKNRRMASSPFHARAAIKAVDLIAINF